MHFSMVLPENTLLLATLVTLAIYYLIQRGKTIHNPYINHQTIMTDTVSADNAPPDTREACPICMIDLPLDPKTRIYEACCGKVICRGCSVGYRRAQINQNKLNQLRQARGDLDLETAEFQLMAATENVACAFCRSRRPLDQKEYVKWLHKRVDKFNDAGAMNNLGDCYMDGLKGVQVDRSKAMELYKRSYDLGSADAADRLSYYSRFGSKEKLEYLKEGARRGNINLTLELGMNGLQFGIVEKEYAVSLIVKAAKAGDDEAMANCWKMFQRGLLSKADLESTMRAKQATLDEVNNEERKYAMRFYNYCNNIQGRRSLFG